MIAHAPGLNSIIIQTDQIDYISLSKMDVPLPGAELALSLIGIYGAYSAARSSGAVNKINSAFPVGRSTGQIMPHQFLSEEALSSHFAKHGARLGASSTDEYLAGANRLFQGGSEIQTFVRGNGDTLFYNPSTNEIAVLRPDGYMRTYFAPDDGILYWLQQTGLGN